MDIKEKLNKDIDTYQEALEDVDHKIKLLQGERDLIEARLNISKARKSVIDSGSAKDGDIFTYIVKTSNLGYDVSLHKVASSVSHIGLNAVEHSGLIRHHRASSTGIEELKEACNKCGVYFEYETLIKDAPRIPDELRDLRIDYTAYIGNY